MISKKILDMMRPREEEPEIKQFRQLIEEQRKSESNANAEISEIEKLISKLKVDKQKKLDEIANHEAEIGVLENSLNEEQNDELDDIDAEINAHRVLIKKARREISKTEKQINRLPLKERSWTYCLAFSSKIRAFCEFFVNHYEPTLHQHVTPLAEDYLEKIISLYFETEESHPFGYSALANIEKKLSCAQGIRNKTFLDLQQRICKLFIANEEFESQISFEKITNAMQIKITGAKKKEELESYIYCNQMYIHYLFIIKDIVRVCDDDLNLENAIHDLTASSYDLCCASKDSYLEISLLEYELKKDIIPLDKIILEMRILIAQMRAETKSILCNKKIEELYSKARIRDQITLQETIKEICSTIRSSVCAAAMSNCLDIAYQIKKSQAAIDETSTSDVQLEFLCTNIAKQKSELLLELIKFYRTVISAVEDDSSNLLNYCDSLYKRFYLSHYTKYVYNSNSQFIIEKDLYETLKFLLEHNPEIYSLCKHILAEATIVEQVIEYDWDDEDYSDDEHSGLPYPPPPCPTVSASPTNPITPALKLVEIESAITTSNKPKEQGHNDFFAELLKVRPPIQ